MKFIIDKNIFENYPSLRIGIIVAYNIDNSTVHAEVEELSMQQQKLIKELVNSESIRDITPLVEWRNAYKKAGINPKDYFSSLENLMRRILKGQSLRPINSLVDLYNIISLKYALPAGGENLDAVQGDITLRYAHAQEPPIVLLGEKEARSPNEGEIIYSDAQGAICRRWNWKEADRTKLTPETKNAFLVLETLGISDEKLENACHELAQLIELYCGGQATVTIMDNRHSEITLKNHSGDDVLLKAHKIVSQESYAYGAKAEQSREKISDEHNVRLNKIEQMRAMGIEPWPESLEVIGTAQEIHAHFKEGIEQAYTIAGRLMTLRLHGKTIFATLQDRTGMIQVYLRKDEVGDGSFEQFERFIDIGDILWFQGVSFRTKTDEITLKVKSFCLLSKSLYPLPEKFHGLTDTETKYRQRYLDLMSNEDTKIKFIKRSKLIRLLRTYLDEHDFIEVETPMLHPIAGGAAARPFITHHNALDSDFYLRIAPELYLKRLVVGGIERVYEINRNFRNEGVSTRHNPEFTMVEFYMAHQDYHFIMGFVEDLLRNIIFGTTGLLQLIFGKQLIDFAETFKRIGVRQAVMEYGNYTTQDLSANNIDAVLKKNDIKLINTQVSHEQKIYALFEKLVEPNLIQPTFIINYPIEISPLAKRDVKDSSVAARFELFIGGMEIANGFNELNDPLDQAERFKQQLEAYSAGDDEAHQYDADYVHALEYGLPPTVGVGIGIDRLVMLVTNTSSIKDVILFPTLKKSK